MGKGRKERATPNTCLRGSREQAHRPLESARFVVAAETSLSMSRGFGNLATCDRRKNGYDIQQAHQIR
jgi:hypothetical protein